VRTCTHESNVSLITHMPDKMGNRLTRRRPDRYAPGGAAVRTSTKIGSILVNRYRIGWMRIATLDSRRRSELIDLPSASPGGKANAVC